MNRKCPNRTVLALLACALTLAFAPISRADDVVSAGSKLSITRSIWKSQRASAGVSVEAQIRPSSPTVAAGGTRPGGPAQSLSVPDGAGGLYIAWSDFRDGTADIYLTRVDNTGAVVAGWPLDGLAVCTAPGDQIDFTVKPDGSGGAIIGWLDNRDDYLNGDAYAQRVGPNANIMWTANGVKVLSGIQIIESADFTPDGLGGFLLVWSTMGAVDDDIFALRIDGTGAVPTGWSATGNLVCGQPEAQTAPKVTSDGSGGGIIAWEDGRAGNGEVHIYVQRMNASGVAQWDPDGRQIDASVVSPFAPAVCPDGSGGAIVFWGDNVSGGTIMGQRLNSSGIVLWFAGGQDIGGGGTSFSEILAIPDGAAGGIAVVSTNGVGNAQLRAQRVNSSGAKQWGATAATIITQGSGYRDFGDAFSDAAGGAYFLWEDTRNGIDNADIFAQRVNATGAPQWGATGIAVCTAPANQTVPTGVLQIGGGLLAGWTDERSFDQEVFVQKLDGAGAPQFVANGIGVYTTPGVQGGSGIVAADDGGALTFWSEKVNGQYDIHGRRFDAAGAAVGPAVAICSAAGNQLIGDAIDDGNGGAILTWVDHRGATDDIYAQRVDATGAPQWTANGIPVCTATGAQRFPHIVSDGVGGCIISWQDERISSQNPNIFAQRLDDTGNAQWGNNGTPVCNDAGQQFGPDLTSDGASGAIIFWTDRRSPAAPAIFAQRVDASGTPQFAANGVNILPMPFGGGVSEVASAPAGNAIVLTNQFIFDFGTGEITSALVAQKINGVGATQWGAAGATVCSAASFILYEHMAPDGFGGAFVGWSDSRNGTFDIFAQRLNPPDGLALWTANGVVVTNAASYQQLGSMTHDSNGNSFYIWADQRGGLSDIYAQQLNLLTGAPQWTANGTRVCGATRGQYLPSLAAWKLSTPCRLFATWTDNRAGTERYVFQQRLDCTGVAQWTADGTTQTLLSLVAADADAHRVRLQWYSSQNLSAAVYRAGADQVWTRVGDAIADGSGSLTYVDTDVESGARYGYKIGVTQAGVQTFSDVTWVDVPAGLAFVLEGFRPNPAAKEPVVAFTLARSGNARLDVIDLAGRRVVQRDLSGLDAGSHVIRLGHTLRPGVYMVALTQGGERRTARAVVNP
jgi:hypothetical protein